MKVVFADCGWEGFAKDCIREAGVGEGRAVVEAEKWTPFACGVDVMLAVVARAGPSDGERSYASRLSWFMRRRLACMFQMPTNSIALIVFANAIIRRCMRYYHRSKVFISARRGLHVGRLGQSSRGSALRSQSDGLAFEPQVYTDAETFSPYVEDNFPSGGVSDVEQRSGKASTRR